MKTDADLLKRYLSERSEEAFRELVQRHIQLVYSVALRRLGRDAQLAEDITQRVFSDLARKGTTLSGRASLSGWLYISTHLASADLVRKERRRKARELEAHIMQETLSSADPAFDADRLRPLLDELIFELRPDDREAVLLRFFEKRPFAEIGDVLQFSEDAARKRVERALEQLRARLADRGISSTAAAVSFALAERVAAAAPVALAAKVAGVACAEVALTGTAGGLLLVLANAITSDFAAIAATVVAAAALLTWQQRANAALQAEIALLSGQDQAIQTLTEDNRRLAALERQTEILRQTKAAQTIAPLPATPATAAKSSVPLSVNVTDAGSIAINGKYVTLDEFLRRMTEFHESYPDPDAKIIIHGDHRALFSQITYPIEEASKSEIKNIVIDSPVRPDLTKDWFRERSWFREAPPRGANDLLPPTNGP